MDQDVGLGYAVRLKELKDLKMAYIQVRKPCLSLIMKHLKAVQG